MSIVMSVGLGFLALLIVGVSCSIAENADKISKYKYESEDY